MEMRGVRFDGGFPIKPPPKGVARDIKKLGAAPKFTQVQLKLTA